MSETVLQQHTASTRTNTLAAVCTKLQHTTCMYYYLLLGLNVPLPTDQSTRKSLCSVVTAPRSYRRQRRSCARPHTRTWFAPSHSQVRAAPTSSCRARQEEPPLRSRGRIEATGAWKVHGPSIVICLTTRCSGAERCSYCETHTILLMLCPLRSTASTRPHILNNTLYKHEQNSKTRTTHVRADENRGTG
jgi:hypothetical protein